MDDSHVLAWHLLCIMSVFNPPVVGTRAAGNQGQMLLRCCQSRAQHPTVNHDVSSVAGEASYPPKSLENTMAYRPAPT